MKHFFLILIASVAIMFANTVSAQCVPDTTVGDTVGLYPRFLADGTVGQPYSQVINIVFPQDTAVNAPPFGVLQADFCTFKVDSVPNLPAGLTYACNTPNCEWIIDHTAGVVNRGCITISGTPTAKIADDSLSVHVRSVVGFYTASTNTCTPTTLPPPYDLLTIQIFRTPFFINDSVNSSIDQKFASWFQLRTVAGNDNAEAIFLLQHAGLVSVEVMDLMGHTLTRTANSYQSAGERSVAVPVQGLPAGIYVTRLLVDGQPVAVTKWIRN